MVTHRPSGPSLMQALDDDDVGVGLGTAVGVGVGTNDGVGVGDDGSVMVGVGAGCDGVPGGVVVLLLGAGDADDPPGGGGVATWSPVSGSRCFPSGSGCVPMTGAVALGPATAGPPRTVRVTNDVSMNTIALETSTISGGSSSIGWPRIAAAPLRTSVVVRSAATALASANGGRTGPWPM